MGYRDGKMGYPSTILQSRSVIKKNNYALITNEGTVKNTIPGFEKCEMSILGSPKLGASFVDYIMTMLPGGYMSKGFGGNGIETFAYVLEGEVEATDGVETKTLQTGGYIFVPEDKEMKLKNIGKGAAEVFLYKRRYKKIEGYAAYTVFGKIEDVTFMDYEDMTDVHFCNLLPVDDLGFDMNFHILSFDQGASHGYIETHVQEHGAYITSGEGMYNLDNEWMPVEKGDYIFMSAYSQQGAYAVGRDKSFSYLYSKDCNRDEEL